jgi:hypothetical protein
MKRTAAGPARADLGLVSFQRSEEISDRLGTTTEIAAPPNQATENYLVIPARAETQGGGARSAKAEFPPARE